MNIAYFAVILLFAGSDGTTKYTENSTHTVERIVRHIKGNSNIILSKLTLDL